MATKIKCGFFNSIGKDRMYTAEEMTRPYELLVSNGVFATPSGTPSSYLQVFPNDGMTVKVSPGRGIFKDKWLVNEADMLLTLEASEVTLNRVDSIVVRIDTSENVREGTITVKKGTPASNAVAPVMERSKDVHEYRLADISVAPRVTSIVQANIKDQRGSADCPWVTSLIKQVDTSTLLAQWQDMYETFYEDSNQTFEEWFAHLKETIATQTLIRTFESTYTTKVQDETVIPINIAQFNDELDILQVHINGLKLAKGTDYTVESIPTDQITLTRPLDVGQQVEFTVYKSVDGSEAETVVGQVFDLQNDVGRLGDSINAMGDRFLEYLPLSGGELSDALNVNGAIRVRGLQGLFSDGTTNMQVGTTALPTYIHGKDDIFLNSRCNAKSIVPNANDAYQIGNADLRYRSIYLTSNPNVSSDRRLKQGIQEANVDELASFIEKLRVVDYRYISDPDTERIGLIAQDVEEAGGSKYVEVSEDGMYGLRTSDLVYPLISAVQALSKRVSDLESQLKKQ